jgi:succinyl-CoA synthetase alpha subunit
MGKIALDRGIRRHPRIIRALSRNGAPIRLSHFSTSSKYYAYADTIQNLKIGSHTRVLYQGFTGRQATINAKESLQYGTKIVGGVKPGVEGEHLGLPVLPSVRVAAERLRPDASVIYVPGSGTAQAIEEAIEAEIPLIVAVAEHIPIHDMLRVFQMLRTQSRTRLVGPNAPGIINTHGRCRLGFQPLPFFQEGKIGIVAKSGTLSYETVASVTRAGLGQTYAISMGGDILAGTTFVDAFKIFEEDEKTEGIIMVGEVGGRAEEEAADWIMEYRRRTRSPKPIMGLVGGVQAPPGRVMGHAGAWAAPGEASSADKIGILERAGVVMVDHPEEFGAGMKQLIAFSGNGTLVSGRASLRRRSFHTVRQRPRLGQDSPKASEHRRSLYIKSSQAADMLTRAGFGKPGKQQILQPPRKCMLALSIDRTERSPCIVASPSANQKNMFILSRKFPFAYGSDGATSDAMLENVSRHLAISGAAQKSLFDLIGALYNIFMTKEAFLLETKIVITKDGDLQVEEAWFGFDDAALKSSGRQIDVHALRDKTAEMSEEVEAEKNGMAYVKLDGEGSLGTIVNGAGLAMNTIDSLIRLGGHPANFLDTGGKATSDTIKSAFKIVCSDQRVKAIFVNIFGGLTRCDMIAEGILLAFKDLQMKVPVVVRLRGTNEAIGQKMVRCSSISSVGSFLTCFRYQKAVWGLMGLMGLKMQLDEPLDFRTAPRKMV